MIDFTQKYNIIQTLEDLEAVDRFMMNGDTPVHKVVAVDTETNGLAFWKDVVIGISFSVNADKGFYLPLLTWQRDETAQKAVKKTGMTVYPNGSFRDCWTNELFPETVEQAQRKGLDWVAFFLKRWFDHSDVSLIMHNAPFDCLMIENNFGLDLTPRVVCDTALLVHVLDENESTALKAVAIRWKAALGLSEDLEANHEQMELGGSVIQNGGTFNKKTKTVWRGDLELVVKYAIADTMLTFGINEVGLTKFAQEYTEKHFKWFFEDEVMPLCREVVIPMKKHGVTIDVAYFQQMEVDTKQKLIALEQELIDELEKAEYLQGFKIGKTVDNTVTKKLLIDAMIAKEGLPYPTTTSKGVTKKTLSKAAVSKAYQTEPHWVWAYLLGEGEIKYSDDELNALKKELFRTKVGKSHAFNLRSSMHLRWLFCSKLGHDAAKLPQTKSGTKDKPVPKLDSKTLREFFADKYTFVKKLLLFKKLDKLYGTYVLPAVTLQYNGILYMEMRQNGTTSGRFSCSGGYNLQTLPKVEDLSKCPACKSKKVSVAYSIALLADATCAECGVVTKDILCPSAVKKGFIAPKGMRIVNADYSSLEPRCFSYMSGDEKLKQVYKEGLDLYSKVYIDMEKLHDLYSAHPDSPKFLKKVDPKKREGVKPVILGIPYGARGPQTANLMGYKKTITTKWGEIKEVLDVERGIAFRDKYLSTYKDLHNYMLRQEMAAHSNGFVETLVGRRRHYTFTKAVYNLLQEAGWDQDAFLDARKSELDVVEYDSVFSANALKNILNLAGIQPFDIKTKRPRTWKLVQALYKQEINNSKNFPIQGLGAHITNKGMLEITRGLKADGIPAWVCLQVHDEITGYAPAEQAEQVVNIFRDKMENNDYAKLLDIPMIAEPTICDNLKDSK